MVGSIPTAPTKTHSPQNTSLNVCSNHYFCSDSSAARWLSASAFKSTDKYPSLSRPLSSLQGKFVRVQRRIVFLLIVRPLLDIVFKPEERQNALVSRQRPRLLVHDRIRLEIVRIYPPVRRYGLAFPGTFSPKKQLYAYVVRLSGRPLGRKNGNSEDFLVHATFPPSLQTIAHCSLVRSQYFHADADSDAPHSSAIVSITDKDGVLRAR